MKTATLLLGVALAAPLTLLAAPPKGPMLLSGTEITTVSGFPLIALATGDARAQLGEFRVHAREIVYDQSSGKLTCRDVKSISPGHAAPEAKDVTLIVQADNVYMLNPAGVVLEPQPTARPAATRLFNRLRPELPRSGPLVEPFSATLPKIDLNLSSHPPSPTVR